MKRFLVEGREVVQLASGQQVWADEGSKSWGEFIAGLRGWELFGALTFDPKRAAVGYEEVWGMRLPRRIPFDKAAWAVESWLAECGRALRRRVDGVVALEAHKSGWPHGHPLVFADGLDAGDIARMGQLWFKRWGYALLERPRDGEAVAEYAAKYLAKDVASGTVLLSKGLHLSRLEGQHRIGGL